MGRAESVPEGCAHRGVTGEAGCAVVVQAIGPSQGARQDVICCRRSALAVSLAATAARTLAAVPSATQDYRSESSMSLGHLLSRHAGTVAFWTAAISISFSSSGVGLDAPG